MGTDYPFDMLEYDPIGHIASVESFDEKTPRRALPAAMRRSCWGYSPLTALRVKKIQHRGLGDHRGVGAVPAGARLLFLRAGRLQIGAEMAGPFDDPVILRQPRRLDSA